MQRIAFRLRIRPEKIADYDEVHRQVWPEMLAALENAGISEYYIFRHGQDLFLTLCTEDWNETQRRLDADEVNQRWQKMMMPYWEPVPGKRDDVSVVMMEQVFYMAGKKTV